MKALTLYQDNGSIIHRVDSITKLFYILASILVPILSPSFTVGLAWAALSIVILLLGQVLRKVFPIIGFSFLILLSIVVIQGLFYPGNRQVLFTLAGLRFYTEGLRFSAGICVRVLNILFAFSILVLTTRPSDLVETLVRRGISPRLGYVLTSVLQIIPQMTATMATITDAQRARGMETEGNLMVRIKALLPLIGPVVMNSLVSTRERSLALEVRGFSSRTPKTFLREEPHGIHDRILQIGLLAVTLAVLAWRILA